MVHVVLVRGVYAAAIEAGRKRVEARLSRSRQAPWGRVSAGDTLWFRRVGGEYFGWASVSAVTSRDRLTPAGVRGLGRRFGRRVGAGATFWEGRGQARYATLVEFTGFTPGSNGPSLKKRPGDRRAWIVLDQATRGTEGEAAPGVVGPGRSGGR